MEDGTRRKGPSSRGYRLLPPLILTGLLSALAVALALRLPRLDERPMHNDEAVNAIKFGQLWERGTYRYDPNEFHGPTLYYGTLPVVWLAPETRPSAWCIASIMAPK